MKKTKRRRWLWAIIGALLLWWGLIISSDIVANWIYTVVHYWKFVLFLLCIYRLISGIIKIFSLRKINHYDEIKNTKSANILWRIWWVLMFVGIGLMLIYNSRIKIIEREFATYLSDHIEFRKWKIPVIYIWDSEKN